MDALRHQPQKLGSSTAAELPGSPVAETESKKTEYDAPESTSASRLYYEVALWRLTEQNRAIESIDSKIASSLSLLGALVVLFVGVVALGEVSVAKDGSNTASEVGSTEWSLAVTVGALFIASAFCAVKGYVALRWYYGPRLSDLSDHSKRYDAKTMTPWTADALSEAQRRNDEGLGSKARWANGSLILSLVALILMVATLLAATFPF